MQFSKSGQSHARLALQSVRSSHMSTSSARQQSEGLWFGVQGKPGLGSRVVTCWNRFMGQC